MKAPKVEDIEITKDLTASKLALAMKKSGGFTAKKLGVAAEILTSMLKDKDSINFLSFPGCIISTGTRGVIRKLVEDKHFDLIITTCGTLDHDLARVWKNYYHGSFDLDDAELHRMEVNRLGNILIPNESYGIILENKLTKIFAEIEKEGWQDMPCSQLIMKVGEKIKDKKSILYWAAKNEIPVIVPAIYDGAFGAQLYMHSQQNSLRANMLSDQNLLAEKVFGAEKTGALMIGGGISKHHTIWWNQYKGGLDRTVFLTSAPEWDGSLSGARTREAVSWGKIKENSKHVTVEGDATINLPLLTAAVYDRI